MDIESNPLYAYGGPFRPSLHVILEDLEREQSSLFQDRLTESIVMETSSSGTVVEITTRASRRHHRGDLNDIDIDGEEEAKEDSPRHSNHEINNKHETEKRLSRLPSLSRMIRTKSGRRITKDQHDHEEKVDDDFDIDERRLGKKRSSLLNIFKY